MPMMNGNYGKMGKKIDKPAEEDNSAMQPVMDMMSEIQSMMEEMHSSEDTSILPNIIAKMGSAIELMSGMMCEKPEVVDKDEYMDMPTEQKDKVDEEQVMGK